MTAFVTTPAIFSPLSRLNESDEFMARVTQDSHVFATFYVMMSPLLALVKDVESQDIKVFTKLRGLLGDLLKTSKNEVTDLVSGSAEGMKTLSEFRKQLGDKVTQLYMHEFVDAIRVYAGLSSQVNRIQLINCICEMIDFLAKQEDHIRRLNMPNYQGAAEINMNKLCELLDVEEGELDLLRLCYLYAVDPSFTIFFRMLEQSIGRSDNMGAITTLLTSEEALDEFEGKLLKFGICSYDSYSNRFRSLSEWWINTLSAPSLDDFYECFYKPFDNNASFRGAMARMSDKQTALIKNLFEQRTESNQGINVLIYGNAKLDLKGSVVELLEVLNKDVSKTARPVYEINRHVRSGDLPGAVAVAQAVLPANACLVVQKAHNALTRNSRSSWLQEFFGPSEEDKKPNIQTADEILLSKNACTTLWITNRIDEIKVDAVSRFLLHIEVQAASRDHKIAAIKKLTASLKLSDEAKQRLLNYSEIDIEQLKAAERVTEIINSDSEQQFLEIVDASQKALGRDQIEEVRPSVTKYNLDLLNIQGKYGPEKILEALKRNGEGTLCFHGMPGTGKTQLAEYIALQLNKPLLVKRASDLLSKWLGEAEKAIAGMFTEAKAQGAVLLLDEADSFLRDRSMARNSWEVTQVNELLQGMERYRGVFICATNLFEMVDSAALRRFTFKLKFNALDAEQRLRMFINETGYKLDSDDKLYIDLMGLTYLTPGDFAAVQRQAKLFGENYTAQEWITQLKAESTAKMAGLVRQNHIGPEGLVQMASR